MASLSLQKNFSRGWALKLEAFHKKLQNVDEYLVYWTGDSLNLEDLPSYIDGTRLWEEEILLGEGRVKGLECSLEKTQGRLSGSISCTFSRSERRFDDLNGGQWFSARFDRLYYVKSLLCYQGGKHFSVSVAWHFASGDAISRLKGGGFLKPGILDLLQPNGSFERIGFGDYRQPQQHRLDVNANWEWRSGKLKYTLSAGLYNAYNRENAHFTLWFDDGLSQNPTRINGLPVLPHLNIGVAF